MGAIHAELGGATVAVPGLGGRPSRKAGDQGSEGRSVRDNTPSGPWTLFGDYKRRLRLPRYRPIMRHDPPRVADCAPFKAYVAYTLTTGGGCSEQRGWRKDTTGIMERNDALTPTSTQKTPMQFFDYYLVYL